MPSGRRIERKNLLGGSGGSSTQWYILDGIQESAHLQKMLMQHKTLASERNQANIQDRQIRMEEVCCVYINQTHFTAICHRIVCTLVNDDYDAPTSTSYE